MSETTEILFNSPALHSLKREQLQKLCKLHSIKANGKNSDLVDKLRQHALTLPNDDPLSIAARSDPHSFPLIHSSPSRAPEDDEEELARISRPSEQWEIVMESIQEVEEMSSQGTLSSLRTLQNSTSGEFGTAGSKSSVVGSSIKAFANSLGLNRNKSANSILSSQGSVVAQDHDELAQNSIPYDTVRAATPPLNDNFTFDPTSAPHIRMSFDSNGDPLPGCTSRPGVRAPDNARLSLGLGPGPNEAVALPAESQATTTLRLVSSTSSNSLLHADKPPEVFLTPKLKPVETTFDLVMSPVRPNADGAAPNFWAPDAHPEGIQSIYPKLTIDDLPPELPLSPIKFNIGNKNAGGTLSTNTNMPTLAVPTLGRKSLSPDPFIFGSPLPEHSVSNSQFKTAATSVLEEMNQRLRLSGVEGVGLDIVEKLKLGAHTQDDLDREMKPLPNRVAEKRSGEIKKKFDEAHQAEFDKMEGIDGVVKRKGLSGSLKVKKSITQVEVPPLVIGKKRKSDVLGAPGNQPRRPTTGLGAAGAVGTGGGRTSGSTRVISNGRRGKVLPGVFDDDDGHDEDLEEAEKRNVKKARMDHDGNVKDNADDAMNVDNEDHEGEGKKIQMQKDKEREAIKRKLDISRAKRRSSAGGPASARRKSGRKSIAQKSKPKFGFLASAKKFVTNMWGKKPAAKPTPAPAASARTEAPQTNNITRKPSLVKKKSIPSFAPTKLAAMTPGSMVNNTSNSGPSVAQGQEHRAPMASSSSRAKSLIPTSSGKSGNEGGSRLSSVKGGSKILRASTSTAGASSLGTRLRTTLNAGAENLGTKQRLAHSGSRLFAPTASSLAKAKKTDEMAASGSMSSTLTTTTAGKVALKATSIGQKKPSSLLGTITNSPKVQGKGVLAPTAASSSRVRAKSPSGLPLWSPRPSTNAAATGTPGKIFSKPLTVTGATGIPVLVSKKASEDGDVSMMDVDDEETKVSGTRQRTLGKKPRISRSKVIAKLASQRAAASTLSPSSSRVVSNPAGREVPGTPISRPSGGGSGLRGKKTRSSFGAAKRGRASIAGPGVLTPAGKGNGERERSVLASAKKRFRQSEVARRRSRVSGASSAMNGE